MKAILISELGVNSSRTLKIITESENDIELIELFIKGKSILTFNVNNSNIEVIKTDNNANRKQ